MGIYITIVKGSDTKNSTEAELVGLTS